MKNTGRSLLAVTVSAVVMSAVMSASPSAEAAVCRGRTSGEGTGMGVAGQGSALARSNALADWSRKVAARDGSRFADTSKARSVRYDCRQGAILEAKCVVSAVPCADSPPKKKKRRR